MTDRGVGVDAGDEAGVGTREGVAVKDGTAGGAEGNAVSVDGTIGVDTTARGAQPATMRARKRKEADLADMRRLIVR